MPPRGAGRAIESPPPAATKRGGRGGRAGAGADADLGGGGGDESARPPRRNGSPAPLLDGGAGGAASPRGTGAANRRRASRRAQSPGSSLLSDGDGDEDDIEPGPFMDAVIKVFATHTEPNWSLPWQCKRQVASTSSGFIVEGRRVLTNAHSVEHATQVKLKHRGSDTKYVAKVLSIGTECDLALLTVEDDAFWAGVTPIKLGRLPRLQDRCTVVGYPIGGDTISVTAGVASRIEMTPYAHSASELLAVQIDAAINSGNSGGPVFDRDGLCVGVAFQSLKDHDAENIGYVIPVPVIQHFLSDYAKNGRYTGFPTLGLEWQKLESPHLRRQLRLPAGEKGVLVRHVEPTSDAAKQLHKGDVLLSFDGQPVASDGTVPFRVGERIGFSHLVSNKFAGDSAALRVWHDGAVRSVRVMLCAPRRLIPVHTAGAPPSYFIVAGLVFTPVTVPYLRSEYGKDFDYDAPVRLLEKMMHGHAEAPDQELVVLSQVLAAEVNIGYEDVVNTTVLRLNGVAVRNLRHLVQLVEGCTEAYLRFDLDYNQLLVLDTAQARAATPAILQTHSIPHQASADLHGALSGAGGAGPAAGSKRAAAATPGKRKAAEAEAEEPAAQGGEASAAAAAAADEKPPAPRRRR